MQLGGQSQQEVVSGQQEALGCWETRGGPEEGRGRGALKLDINSYFLSFQKLLSLKIKEKSSPFLEHENHRL